MTKPSPAPAPAPAKTTDLYSSLDQTMPTNGLQSALLSMFDKVMQSGKIADPAKVDALAKCRAQVAILLKNL